MGQRFWPGLRMTARRHVSSLRLLAPVILAGLMLVACMPQPGPPPPARADSSLAPAAATAALAESLVRNGLGVERVAGGLRATSADPRFALCDTIWVRERTSGSQSARGRFTRPDSTSITADIRIADAPRGSVVTWRTFASGNYLNRFDNRRFDVRCATSGELEQLIEDAVRG